MKNSIIKKIAGKLDYNGYKSLTEITFCSNMTLLLFTDTKLLTSVPGLNESFIFLYFLSSAFWVWLLSTEGKYSKDVVEIKKLYTEFIKNYNKLNKIFDLKDPVQVYMMYSFLLRRGYLSVNKTFEFSTEEIRDYVDSLSGTNVFTGGAVCRNTAPMLADILNDYGVLASAIDGHAEGYVLIPTGNDRTYSKEEIIDWISIYIEDIDKQKRYLNWVKELYDDKDIRFSLSYENPNEDDSKIKERLRRRHTNHAITLAYQDGKSYFLDPTFDTIFRRDKDNPNMLYAPKGDFLIKRKVYKPPKELLKPYPTISIEDEERIHREIHNMCNNNLDVFDKFYRENEELYRDVSNMVLKIKKRVK